MVSLLILIILASVMYRAAEMSQRSGILWAGIFIGIRVGLVFVPLGPVPLLRELLAFGITFLIMWIANAIRGQA